MQGFTHNIDNDNPTRLDLVFTNNLMDIEDMKHLAPVGKSHHVVLESDYLIDTDYNLEVEDEHRKYCYHKCNCANIRRELAAIDWDILFNNKAVTEMYNIFVAICLALIEKYVLKIKCQNTRHKPKWMTRDAGL